MHRRIRVKIKARYRMTGLLIGGMQEIFQEEQDLLILKEGMQDSFKLDGRLRDEKRKSHVDGRSAESCDSN